MFTDEFILFLYSLKSLPNECKKYTYVTDKASCVFEKDYSKNNQINFTTEIFENLDMYRVARELSGIPVQTLSEMYSLYTGLGGNGPVEDYYAQIKRLPIHNHK